MKKYLTNTAYLIILVGMISCSPEKAIHPVLVLSTDSDYGSYTAEILKTEGLNEFVVDSFTGENVTASYLEEFKLVIIAESNISSPGLNAIKEYVKSGGRLIAIHPDPRLAEIFGVSPAGKSISTGYIRIDTTRVQGTGLTSSLLQFHGDAVYYTLNGGTSLADLVVDKNSTERYPAVVSNNYGKGRTVAFLYNLPRSVVLTRQGNPDFAGMEKDGIPGLRSTDMFTDGWVDTSNNKINQADEQMVLLSHCIESILADNNITLVPHAFKTGILVAASIQLIAALTGVPFLEFSVTESAIRKELLVKPFIQKDGFVEVPESPGLGIDLNPEVIKKYGVNMKSHD